MRLSVVTACAALSLLGCDPSDSTTVTNNRSTTSPAPTPPQAPAAPKPIVEAELEYGTRIETKDGKSTVYWTAKVPTGGYTMTTDQPPLVEERNTLWWARVYVTIEAPNPKDTVAQAFETLSGKFEADRKIDRVEFSVRRKVKGVESPWAPLYQIVKTGPDGVTPQDTPRP